MKAILLGLALIAGAIAIDTEQLKSDLSEIERDAMALELYLQDKQDHEDYCPHISWEQPSLNTYKETLISHLPEGCK